MKRSVVLSAIIAGIAILVFWGARTWSPKTYQRPSDRPTEASVAASGAQHPQATTTVKAQETYSAETSSKLKVLDEILKSRNDNDPRLDQDFNQLSNETKQAFRKRYQELPLEKRNERGTIVFLLGRNLQSPEDYAFLNEVLSEAPCLSMADCSKESKTGGEAHSDIGVDVSLAYPQVVALKRIEQALDDSRANHGGRLERTAAVSEAIRSVELAKSSRIPMVARMAADIEQRFGTAQ